MVAGISPSLLATKPSDPESKESWRYPTTIFVHMARDRTTAAWIEEDIVALHNQVMQCGLQSDITNALVISQSTQPDQLLS